MSVQTDLESTLATMLGEYTVGLGNTTQGPKTQASVEGSERHASVRVLGARGDRLSYGQTSFSDSIAITVWWRESIDRATRFSEWDAFCNALIADQYLGGSVDGLQDAYLVLEAWGEAVDGAFVIMAAELETERVA